MSCNKVTNKNEDLSNNFIKKLDMDIHEGLFIEAFHDHGSISDIEYFTKYQDNAENLFENLQIRKELKEVDEIIEKIEKT